MAQWDKTMVTLLRVLIDDLDPADYTYDDCRLQQVLVVGAQYVNQEIDSFANTYTVDVNSPDISPDPTVTESRDDAFTNLTVLKAACIVDQSLFRTRAMAAGIRARCGPAILETRNHLVGFSELLDKGPCAAYEKLKLEYQMGNAQACRAILSPFIGNNFNPRNMGIRGAGAYPGHRGGGHYQQGHWPW